MRRISTRLLLTGFLAGVSLGAPVWADDANVSAQQQAGGTCDHCDAAAQASLPESASLGRVSNLSDKDEVALSEDENEVVLIEPQQSSSQTVPQATTNVVVNPPANPPVTGSQAGTTQDTTMTGTTVAEERPPGLGPLSSEILAVRPNAGALVFNDTVGNTATRAIYGLTMDWNFAAAVSSNPRLYIGPSTGGLFSHLGSASSTFFGANPDNVVNSPGANMILIPANLKLGVNVTDNFRIAARGGGNVIYRSEGVSMNLGPSTATTGQIWRIYPNVGADIDFGITRGVSLGLRPDYTFTPGNNIFTGTVALGISIG